MKIQALLLAFLLPMSALAGDPVRCGTDAFGNTVCMDKDRVLTNSPAKADTDKTGVASGVKAAASGPGNKSGTKAVNEATPVRCGIDQFGNKVCL